VAKDPLNPLIVEWPGTSKVALDSASKSGVVVVSYVGCVLKVLTSCQAGGGYDFKAVTPVRDKVSIENETDLYARLPLGVASLKGELATSGRLDLEYVAVGQRETAKPPVSLSGECAGATHYVRTIMVGAYGLDAVGKAKASGAVDVAGKGGGAEHAESVRHLRGSGEVDRCAGGANAKADDCGAVLQLGLAPLMVSGGGAVTAAGFGAGLGALAAVPTVQEFQTLPGGGQSLAAADVHLLQALQEAKRADKGSGAPEGKAAAWDALARYEGKANPYKELAERRREDWKRVAEAEARRKEQFAKVCSLGNDAPAGQLCWKRSNQGTCPVGGYPQGDAPGGIHDLAGNVWEWTSSAYDGSARVNRGGGWSSDVADYVRASYRAGLGPGARGGFDLGFRCAR
jgi:hypothetical protein